MVHYRGKIRGVLNVVRKTNIKWRDPKSLLDPTSEYPRRGNESTLNKKIDRQIPVTYGSPRYWRERAFKQMEIRQRLNLSALDDTNCYELKGRFRFTVSGIFKSLLFYVDNGNGFSMAIKRVADNLQLVGWCRVRCRGGEGLLEGDVYGLDDMKRWLKSPDTESHKTQVQHISFSEETAGLEVLQYPDFAILFDYRSLAKVAAARQKARTRAAALSFLRGQCRQAEQRQKYMDENFTTT